MGKNDLKFGDIVTTRDGEKWICSGTTIKNDLQFINISQMDDDFKNIFKYEWDIMKVERYIPAKTITTPGYDKNLYELKTPIYAKNLYELKTIYERKEEILDKEEKEYLSNMIRPFRDRIKFIVKYDNPDEEVEFIYIGLNTDCAHLPIFENGTMYKGMKVNKKYTLEELEL